MQLIARFYLTLGARLPALIEYFCTRVNYVKILN